MAKQRPVLTMVSVTIILTLAASLVKYDQHRTGLQRQLDRQLSEFVAALDTAPRQKLLDLFRLSSLGEFVSCFEVRSGTDTIWSPPGMDCSVKRSGAMKTAAFPREGRDDQVVRFKIALSLISDRILPDIIGIAIGILLTGGVLTLLVRYRWLPRGAKMIADAEKTITAQLAEMEEMAAKLADFREVELDLRAAMQRAARGEHEVRLAQQQLRDAIEAVPDGFVLYDSEDRLVWCNQKYREVYPESAEFIVPGATFEDIIRGGVSNGQYAEAIGNEEQWIAERMARHRNPAGDIVQKLGSPRLHGFDGVRERSVRGDDNYVRFVALQASKHFHAIHIGKGKIK